MFVPAISVIIIVLMIIMIIIIIISVIQQLLYADDTIRQRISLQQSCSRAMNVTAEVNSN